ncbi:MAG: hypothetical protein ACK5TO_06845, partial [Planctomycetaceae bacterium]
VVGLPVLSKGNNNDLQIEVGPGTAVVPSGRRVVVSATQCARLNDWLRRELPALQTLLTAQSPTPGATPAVDPLKGTVTVAVVLSHVDCPTDRVPLPGEPCRTEEEALAPSRIQDHFRLALRLQRPDQREEEALRALVNWVAGIPISDTASSATEEQLCGELRKAAKNWPSGQSPSFSLDAPPTGLSISTAQAPALLRSLFRVWTIELRPRCRPKGLEAWCGCGGNQVSADATGVGLDEVLLAELVLDLSVGGNPATVVCQKVTVDESRRPFLLHTRFLQEWLLAKSQVAQAAAGAVSLAGDVTGVSSQTKVVALQGQPVSANTPAQNQVLSYDGGSWRPTHLSEAKGEVEGPLVDLKVKKLGGIEVESPATVTPGAVLTLDSSSGVNRWTPQLPVPTPIPSLPNLQGDVTGSLQNNQVAKVQGLPVAAPPVLPAQDDEVLLVRSGQWTRGLLPSADGDVTGPWNGLKVAKLGGVPLQIPQTVPANRFLGVNVDDPSNPKWEARTVDLTGDVTGESGSTVVTKLRGFPLVTPMGPTAGVLSFDGSKFAVKSETTTNEFVRTPGARSYEIVAAGNFLLMDGQPLGSPHGGLALKPLESPFKVGEAPWIYRLEFATRSRPGNQYVINATPFLNQDLTASELNNKSIFKRTLSSLPGLVVNTCFVNRGEVLCVIVHRLIKSDDALDAGLSIEVSRFEV